MVGAHGLQHTQHTRSIHVGRKFGSVEADLHMTLCGEVVDLGGLHLGYNLHQRHGVAQIAVVEMEVGLALEMGDALTIVHAGATDDAVHLVAFGQQELAEIAAVLAGDTCY